MAAGYLATNLLFASLYWLAGPDAITGAGDVAARALRGLRVLQRPDAGDDRLRQARPGHARRQCARRLEALVGLLGFAILSGLLFARFTRPTAKIAFSRNAIIAPYGDGWALMFRLVNLRNHDLTDVHAVVSLARWVDENGARRRRFDQLALERDAIIFMPLHWVVVHPITDESPLRGLTPESLAASDPEIVCLISADDETFAQTVHAKTSYDKADIVWGARFRDMYWPTPIGSRSISRGSTISSRCRRRVRSEPEDRLDRPRPQNRTPGAMTYYVQQATNHGRIGVVRAAPRMADHPMHVDERQQPQVGAVS